VDWGCMYFPRADQPWWHNRVSLDHRAEAVMPGPEGGQNAEITEFASIGSADLAASQMLIRALGRQPEVRENRPHSAADYEPAQEIARSVWRRRVMLLKQPDYIVVRDDLDSAYPSDWSLHVLADGAAQEANRVHLRGQHGVDLDVLFVMPRKPPARLGEWGFAYSVFECDRAAWDAWHEMLNDPAVAGYSCLPVHPAAAEGEERGRFVRIRQGPGKPYLAVLFPRRPDEPAPRVQALAGSDGFKLSVGKRREWVWLAAAERAFEDRERAFIGRAGAIRHDGDARELILLDGARFRDGELAVEGEGPVSIVATQRQIEGCTYGPARTLTVHIPASLPRSARRVRMEGALHRVRWHGNRVTLAVPHGRHEFTIGP
jgi:hypothetical protein